ncbi:MAG: hypothetical protein HY319_21500 [Armatimonadetes bacterium]|nr:hypothetical protein [Armatimonadota bacterium]
MVSVSGDKFNTPRTGLVVVATYGSAGIVGLVPGIQAGAVYTTTGDSQPG